ncbi:MAG: endonuclease domain-containing protein [Pseudolabrys sp.]
MTARARRLRSASTDAELKLWRALRRDQLHNLHFRRQHPVGPYTLDFYCPVASLAIELDGGQHAEPANIVSDERRTAWLSKKGIKVLRFWNNDVLQNLAGVLEQIADHAGKLLTPPPNHPRSGGGRRESKRFPPVVKNPS